MRPIHAEYQYQLKEKREERSRCLRLGNALGLAMLLVILVPRFLNRILSGAVYWLQLPAEVLEPLFNGPVTGELWNVLYSLLTFIPGFILAARVMRTACTDLFAFRRPAATETGACLLLVLAASVLGNYLSYYLSFLLESTAGVTPYNPDFSAQPSWFGFAVNVLATAIAPALIEEFAFRGVALSALRRIGDIPALIVSSLLFAVMHGNLSQAPFAFITGLGLGLAYLVTGCFWVPVAGHFLVNFISCCIDFSYNLLPESMISVIYASYQMAVVAVSALIVIVYGMRRWSLPAFPPSGWSGESAGRRYYTPVQRGLWVLASPVMVVYLVLIAVRLATNMVAA